MNGPQVAMLAFMLILVGVLAILAVESIKPEKATNCPAGNAAQNETALGVFQCISASALGLVNSVSNSDGTLTISPTTGAVVASLNLSHGNTWLATQTFSGSSYALLLNNPIEWSTDTELSRTAIGTLQIQPLTGNNPADLALVPIGSSVTSAIQIYMNPNTNDEFLAIGSNQGGCSNCFAINAATNSGTARELDFENGGTVVLGITTGDMIKAYSSIIPSAASTYNLGASGAEWNNVNIDNNFNFYGTSGDAQPILRLTESTAHVANIKFGSGGSNVLDFNITRSTTPNLLTYWGHILVFGLSETGIDNTQGFQSVINQALTNPSTSTNISLPVNEPDTSYGVVCTGNFAGVISVSGKMTNQFTVNYPAIAVGTDKVDCIVTHQ